MAPQKPSSAFGAPMRDTVQPHVRPLFSPVEKGKKLTSTKSCVQAEEVLGKEDTVAGSQAPEALPEDARRNKAATIATALHAEINQKTHPTIETRSSIPTKDNRYTHGRREGRTSKVVQKVAASKKQNILAPVPAGVRKLRSSAKPLKNSNTSKGQSHMSDNLALKTRVQTKFQPKKQEIHAIQQQPKQSRLARPEHSLSLAFRDATTAYTSHLTDSIPPLFADVKARLKMAFSEATEKSTHFVTEITQRYASLGKPVGQEELSITTKRGTVHQMTTTVLLADRMANFNSTLEAERAKLDKLWKEWCQNRREIQLLGAQVFGGEATLENATPESSGLDYASEIKQIETDYAKKKDAIMARFEVESRDLVDRVVEMEKKLDGSRKQQHQKLAQMMKQMQDLDY